MKFTILFICCSISLSASAQWYRLGAKPKPVIRFPLIEQVKDHSIARIAIKTAVLKPKLYAVHFERSQYSLEAEEDAVMKTAQHNMRFRIYTEASYNFSALAQLYLQQNRFSEAKWYLLQSNIISRQQNDDKHTISNLIELANIKANIGEYELAQQDLTEAHEIAAARGMLNDVSQIEKKMRYIKQNRLTTPKAELRYAEAVENTIKGQ